MNSRSRYAFRNGILSLLVGCLFSAATPSQARRTVICDKCARWHAMVIPGMSSKVSITAGLPREQSGIIELNPSSTPLFNDLRSDELYDAIQCLLNLQGNREASRITGATRPDISQTLKRPTIEVAALYVISFLYYQKWDHASGALLVDKFGKWNSDDAIQAAFRSYKKWFGKLREIGIEEARKQKLDPLSGTELRWYP